MSGAVCTIETEIIDRRRRLRRNQLAMLMLAQGVPLLLAGDEAGNSQNGNNNAYCQDNPIGWVDWSALGKPEEDLTPLIGDLARLRQRFPQLKPHRWLVGRRDDGSHDILWLTPGATEMMEQDWNFAEGRYLSYVLAPVHEGGEPLFIVLNATDQPIEFKLPPWPNSGHWITVLDTSSYPQTPDPSARTSGSTLSSPTLSVLAFAGQP